MPEATIQQPPADLISLLDLWVEQGWLRPIDRALTRFLQTQSDEQDEQVLLLAALTSQQLGHGHICIDIGHLLDNASSLLANDDNDSDLPTPADWLGKLSREAAIKVLQGSAVIGDGPGNEPLVLSDGRLYLRRYWQYEQSVAGRVRQLLEQQQQPPADLAEQLAQLFPALDDKGTPNKHDQADWQKIACALAARGKLTLITGGPGTGKTTTVVRLLGLLQEDACSHDQPLRIRLAAPTGKAAARLTESIGNSIAALPFSDEVKKRIPAEVVTLHRLLGRRPGSRHFRHNRDNPLHADLVVIDEASMIDLEMMASLLDALGPDTALVLIGDKDQLASVEAGAVMGDLCRDADTGNYNQDTLAWVKETCGEDISHFKGDGNALAQQTAMLRRNHRFGADSGIGTLARAVNAGDADKVEALWQGSFADISRISLKRVEDKQLDEFCINGYRKFLAVAQQAAATDIEQHAAEVLTTFSGFQLLCALRNGPAGVTGLNRRIATSLHRAELIDRADGWYPGRPVIVTRNDYALGLMNGDVGVTLNVPDEHNSQRLRVAFQLPDGRIKLVLPSRLDAVETVYAMTVHKSQGSEFAHTALVLPDSDNPVLTRELLYTAVTRASARFTLLTGNDSVVTESVKRRTWRASGLSGLL